LRIHEYNVPVPACDGCDPCSFRDLLDILAIINKKAEFKEGTLLMAWVGSQRLTENGSDGAGALYQKLNRFDY